MRMRSHLFRAAAFALMFGNALLAQDLAGDWQGTLHAGVRDLRMIVRIAGSAGARTEFAIKTTSDCADCEFQLGAGSWTQGAPLPLELTRATPENAWKDPATHAVQFVSVENNVRLEVLELGGSGRPLVLLTGLGNPAHVFDKFAPKLTATYHVYGISRRGYGLSSAPASGYSADRLGDDVLAVIDALKLDRPVLAGHSIAGEELSSIASRHPEKVAAMIYLDAGYSYAYFDPSVRGHGSLAFDLTDLQKKLEQLVQGKGPSDPRSLIQELLNTILPDFEKDLAETEKDYDAMPPAMLTGGPTPAVVQAILEGEQRYTKLPVPILAIFAIPYQMGPGSDKGSAVLSEFEVRDEIATEAQVKAFANGVPSARVVRLPHANHYIFLSNETDVLREMNAFIGALHE